MGPDLKVSVTEGQTTEEGKKKWSPEEFKGLLKSNEQNCVKNK